MSVGSTTQAGQGGYDLPEIDAGELTGAGACSAEAPAEASAAPSAQTAAPAGPSGPSGRAQVTQLMGELLRHTLDAALPGGAASKETLAGLLRAAVGLFKAIQSDPEAANQAMRDALFDHKELCQGLGGFADKLAANPAQAILEGLRTLSAATSGDGLGARAAGCLGDLVPQPRIGGETSGEWGRQGRVTGSTTVLGADLAGGLEGRVGAQGTASGQASLGRGGFDASGQVTGSAGTYGAAWGAIDTGLGSVAGRAQGGVGVRGGASGNVHADLSGIEASGAAQARVGVEGSVEGHLRSALLDANAKLAGDYGAYAEANGQATVNADGLQARGRAEVGVRAQVEVDADFRTAGTTIGGERLDLNGQVHAVAEASARAEVEADVAATLRPPRVLAELGAEAFVGVKAGVEGSVGIGDFITLSGHAEAWAGAGAEAGIVCGYDDGKLRFGFNFGAALEVGAGAGVGIEIDVKSIANAIFGLGADAVGLDVALDDIPGLCLLFADYGPQPDDGAAHRRQLDDIQRSVLEAASYARQQAATSAAGS